VVGGDAVASVSIHNRRSRTSLGTRVEVPVGDDVAVFDIGTMAPDATRDEPFVIPTDRRAVIGVEPARTVKGDSHGIARREVSTGENDTLYVHPRPLMLPQIAAVRIRAPHGRTTVDLSTRS